MKLITAIILIGISLSTLAQNPKHMIGRGYGETYTINLKTGESYSEFKKVLKDVSYSKDSTPTYRYYLGMPFDVPFRLKVIPKNKNVKSMKLFLVGKNLNELSKSGEVSPLDLTNVTLCDNLNSSSSNKDIFEVQFHNIVDSEFIFYMPPLNVSKEYDFQFIENVKVDKTVIKYIERFYNHLLDLDSIKIDGKNKFENPYYRNFKIEDTKNFLSENGIDNVDPKDFDEELSKVLMKKQNIIRSYLKTVLKSYDNMLILNVSDDDLLYKDDYLLSLLKSESRNISSYFGKDDIDYLKEYFKLHKTEIENINIISREDFLFKTFGLYDFKTNTVKYTHKNEYIYINKKGIQNRINNLDSLLKKLYKLPSISKKGIKLDTFKSNYKHILLHIKASYINRIKLKENIEEVILQKAEKIVGNEFNTNLSKIDQGILKATTHADYSTRTEYFVTADVGLAYLMPKNYYNDIQPYFGVNFHFGAINRQVHYSMFKPMKYKMKFWPRIWKNTSAMVGISFDLNGAKSSSKSLNSDKQLHTTFSTSTTEIPINLYTGMSVRIWDPVRIAGGVVWTKETTSYASSSYYQLKPTGFISVSFDVDVGKYLGQLGNTLFFNRQRKLNKKEG